MNYTIDFLKRLLHSLIIISIVLCFISYILLCVNYSLTRNHFNESCTFEFVDDINPLDESVIGFMKKYENFITCPLNDSNLNNLTNSFLDLKSGIIHVCCSINITCSFRNFKRMGDNVIKYNRRQDVTDHFRKMKDTNLENMKLYELDMIKLRTDFIEISCGSHNKSYAFPTSVYYSRNITTKSNITSSSNPKRYNIFILIIESMSRINFKRYLNLTGESIQSIINAKKSQYYNLKGSTKIGDNSFPNMFTLFTGKSVNLFNSNVLHEQPFDRIDFIWKTFELNGYTTALIEDSPKWTLFNYKSKGFINQPTDYYPRPYWINIHENGKRFMNDICYQDTAKFDILLNQAETFIHHGRLNKIPTFTFAMNIAINHNDFNELQIIDTHLSDFISSFGNYDDTIFMIMGDHGSRFGEFLHTEIGWIEERMPYFGMFVPNELINEYQTIGKYLKLNEYRLITWFDIHSMLKDIALGNFKAKDSSSNSLSYSPWREEVPKDRTCKSANIQGIYCTCNKFIANQTYNDEQRVQIGLKLVELINLKIERYENICEYLMLKKVVSFDTSSNHNLIRTVVEVLPSNGIYRAVFANVNGTNVELKGDVTRIDSYFNQDWCMNDRTVGPYCYCKS